MARSWVSTPLAWVIALLLPTTAFAGTVTYASDSLRTGWYSDQVGLSPSIVSGGTFGSLFSTLVDGPIYGQPLVSNGVVFVATQTNWIYGLSPATGAIVWSRQLHAPFNPMTTLGCGDIYPSVGVTATPVIDDLTATVYFTAKTYATGTSGPAVFWMHAVDIRTGAEQPNFPVLIQGAAQNNPGQLFDATRHNQRPALLLMNGVVYAAFGSVCDVIVFQGWVIGVSTAGAITTRWVGVSGVNNFGAGIWMSGSGLVSDRPGSIVFATGNNRSPTLATPGYAPPADLGESMVRLNVQADGSLQAVDFFAPYDAPRLDSFDGDLGSGGPVALPSPYFGTATIPNLLTMTGKEGYVYLLDANHLGGMRQGSAGGDAVVSRIGPYGGVWSRAGVWPGDGGWLIMPTGSGTASASATTGVLRFYRYGLDGAGKPTLALAASSTDAFGFSSSSPIVTSNGTGSGTALVWVVWSPDGTGIGGQLRAYDAVPQSGAPILRWSAPIGTVSKFVPPGVYAGRLYVGTRDGHVLGFGSTVTPPLTAGTLSFPDTNVGATSTRTATFTANATVTVQQLISADKRFAVGAPTRALPATLTAGQTISVPVTFAPVAVGLAAATLTATTPATTVQMQMSGSGRSPTAKLVGLPAAISFGGVGVGSVVSSTVTFSNQGGTSLRISGSTSPASPFSVSGLPAIGATLLPGQSVSTVVTYAPIAPGNFASSFALVSSSGTATVQLTGSAAPPGVMVVSPQTIDFGSVGVGGKASATFTVSNTGGTAITMMKSKPPVLGQFVPATSLFEGTLIQPGASVTETVLFQPLAAGTFTDQWVLNSDGLGGLQPVTLSGVATDTGITAVPDPIRGGWQLNGAARLLGSIAGAQLELTPALANSKASAFWPTSVSSASLTAEFDVTMNGGDPAYGADGVAFILADPARGATPLALGGGGGGVGAAGIPGISAALETYPNSMAGVANNGTDPTATWLSYMVQTTIGVPDLRAAVRHVKVAVSAGVMTIAINGIQVVQQAVSLPPQVMVGFSGSTGPYLIDRHAVANVTISSSPPPAQISGTPLSLSFGSVGTGASAQNTVTIQNTGGLPLQVTGVTPPLAPFSVAGLPAVGSMLAAGASTTAIVTFAPTAAGASTSSFSLATSAGPLAVSFSGTGIAPPPAVLSVSPAQISFVSVALGSAPTATVTIANTGGQPLTINSVTSPAAPFGASGVPAAGTTIAGGQSVAVTVSFSPSALGAVSDSLVVASSAGSSSVALSGTAVLPIQVTPSTVGFGLVATGSIRTANVVLSNVGSAPVTISSVSLPAAPFSVAGAPASGAVLAAGATITATVTFAPTVAGAFSGQFAMTIPQGVVTVSLSGSAVAPSAFIPDPSLGGWTLNGSSLVSAGALVLTPAATGTVGTAFWPTSVPSTNISADFDVTMTGGYAAYGADGVSFIFGDPASGATALSLGGGGGALGAGGVPGFCVGLESYPNSLVGVANNGTTAGQTWISYLAQTSAGVPDLRSSVRHVKIVVSSGTVSVSVDGFVILTQALSLPPNVLIGFGGANGPYLFDRHSVSNVTIAAQ